MCKVIVLISHILAPDTKTEDKKDVDDAKKKTAYVKTNTHRSLELAMGG